MIGEEGADLGRTIFGHSDQAVGDVDLLVEVLAMGACVQFDTLGMTFTPYARYPDVHNMWHGPRAALEVLVGEAIPRLIEEGYEDRILLSQDVCTKMQLKAYGGNGYSFLLERFLPYLGTQGVTDAQVQKMMVDNPRRLLTFGEPV